MEPLLQLVSLQPSEPESHYFLGNTYMMAGKFDEAIKSFNKVLLLKPDHTVARERIQVATTRKHLAPKLEAYRRNVAENPRKAAAHSDLGQTYNALAMFAEAEQAYQSAIRLEPNSGDYYNLLAINYAEWGKTEKAVEAYERAVSYKPNHVFYLSLGESYTKLGKMDEAVRALQKSLEIKPSFNYALFELGKIYAGQGRHHDAIPLFKKILESEPTHVFANHALGVMYAMTGNKAGAMQQYYILENLNKDVANALLRSIPK